MRVPSWLSFPVADSGPSAWRRAAEDTDQFRSSFRGFWTIEVLAAVVGTALAVYWLATRTSSPVAQVFYGGIGLIAGLTVAFAGIYAFNLALAPYRQRNDARSQLESRSEPALVTDVLDINEWSWIHKDIRYLGIRCANKSNVDIDDVYLRVHSLKVLHGDLGAWFDHTEFGARDYPSVENGYPFGNEHRSVGIGSDEIWGLVRIHPNDNNAITTPSLGTDAVALQPYTIHEFEYSVGARGFKPYRAKAYVHWGGRGLVRVLNQTIANRWIEFTEAPDAGSVTPQPPVPSTGGSAKAES